MTTTTIFYPVIATIIGLLLVAAINKERDYSTLLLGSMGVLLTVMGVILLAAPLQYETGFLVDQDTGSSPTQTTYTYTEASTALNTALALTLTILGVMSAWVANMQRKDKQSLTENDDGLGGFDD